MSISKEQWAEIEERLMGFYVHVKFTLSGHEITINKQLVKENQFCLVVFIDERIKSAWHFGDADSIYDPIVKQVWRKFSRALYSPAKKKRMIKAFGAREARRVFPNMDKVNEYWSPDFKTAASLVRQFKKIDGLELVAEPVKANG
ncbi:hypothetical protein [Zhongshania aliphaticivorans]|uniref:hypothetical protein n=1 Tax=Zhongshania aliphaticivorans TaxID=1470434 RepID=UPI0012E61611|nr:hypothetical protein [Zhongshania aliphaticivorans]CAA0103324.1 Uncharacterised protein [Zhongshania aliphaticivorans]